MFKFIKRLIYSIRKLYVCRHNLNDFFNHDNLIPHVTDLDLSTIEFKALVLDFDGVLAPHGSIEILPEVQSWLDNNLNNAKIFILSNKPFKERIQWVEKNYPNINFIIGKRKKPYPDGLNEILTFGYMPQDILMIDDRISTGILSAIDVGCKAKLVTSPYRDLKNNFYVETFFAFLCLLEHMIFSIYDASK